MVGVAVPLSLDRIVEREGRSAALRRVLVRGLLMYTLGVLYYGGISHGWDQIRWVGVLQRLAAGYVAAALLHLWCRPRTIVAVGATLLVGYWALLTFVPVPGVGAGDYARGRNLANWVDAHWLPGKVWYGDYDPEGLLSTLPALVSALLGLACRRAVLRDARSAAGRLRCWWSRARSCSRSGTSGACSSHLQAHLDLLVCAGDRWLELPAAGGCFTA
jgi:predicted acyltransferase